MAETKFNVSMPHFSAMESPIVLMDLMKTVIYVQKVSIVFFQNHPKIFMFVNIVIKTMFGSSLPPVVCRRARVLFTLFVCVCVQSK
jgi:hypothetical protein